MHPAPGNVVASPPPASSWAKRAACLLLAGLAACGAEDRASRPQKVMVFAAASLTAAFGALEQAFEQREPECDVELHFAGTPQLVLQVREGAPVDVFASADEANMQRVVDAGKVVGAPVSFAENRLTIVTAAGNPKNVRSLADLARDDLRVVLCGPEVPAGRYARQALQKAGVEVASVSDEPSVKAVVNKVALGEVDAGIVYVTDATAAAAQVAAVPVPDQHNVAARYPIAVLGAGRAHALGERFVAFVCSPDGQTVLRRFGFSPP
ncbi:MAG: molybdate ABC transporter substrate-binding protein [Planctomycetes bacterium]|nr:molybdate ABC transporter substrate-binding protein [Planctomycetota bacterium]